MPRPFGPILACATFAVALPGATSQAADLPFSPSSPPVHGQQRDGGGGFHVARVPLRPAPLRYDVYGYPLLGGVPDPLAAGGGCPSALQPDYDPDGNFAGYAPVLMCR